jgi:hypothetical protein
LLGYIRSRNLEKLASAADLFLPALHGREVFKHLRQVQAFFKKNTSFTEDERCLTAAKASFLSSEESCKEVNLRLDKDYLENRFPDDLKSYLSRAEGWLDKTLGSFDSFLEEIPKLVRVTSGATADLSRRKAVPALKLGRSVTCTRGAQPYLEALVSYYGYKKPFRFALLEHNRVEVVPKNWKTHRTIACEPTGNVPLQLAFDTYSKRKLRRRGIDLSDQSLNQELARQGSIDGSLATIDLSSASDTIAFNVVALLFPTDWFNYLNALRSQAYSSPDFGDAKYEKFSSMGNGSTFAIETLVFSACCYAVGSRNFNVYGDDIIVETGIVDELVRLLNYLGFTVNLDKSYTTGPFRESCGTDWYEGVNITPFYLREEDNRKSVWSHNVNGLAALSYPGSKLAGLLKSIVIERGLRLVPWNYSTTSGVFVDSSTAYDLKLFRSKFSVPKGLKGFCSQETGIQRFKSYVSKETYDFIRDSRSLFLWHLTKVGVIGDVSHESTRVPKLNSKYCSKWVVWHCPARPTPGHLYWWSETLIREDSTSG